MADRDRDRDHERERDRDRDRTDSISEFLTKSPSHSLGGDALSPNPDEVCDWAWTDIADLEEAVAAAPFVFSPWLVRQLAEGIHAGGRL